MKEHKKDIVQGKFDWSIYWGNQLAGGGGTNTAHQAPYVALLIRVSRRNWGNQRGDKYSGAFRS